MTYRELAAQIKKMNKKYLDYPVNNSLEQELLMEDFLVVLWDKEENRTYSENAFI